MINRLLFCLALFLCSLICVAADVRVGAAAVELEADDSMVIAGGIGPGKASGQEGKLRCVATVLAQGTNRFAIVACDVLMLTRASRDPVVERIESEIGIPAAHLLVNCTHTHHAPEHDEDSRLRSR